MTRQSPALANDVRTWVDRPPVVLAGGTIDFARSRFLPRGRAAVALSDREAEVLAFLVDHINQTVTRDALLEQVFGYSTSSTSRAVDTCIARLRRKLEVSADAPEMLFTAHGAGYRLVIPTEDARAAAAAGPSGVRKQVTLVLTSGHADLGAGLVVRDGQREVLTEQERQMLSVLAAQDGQLVEGRELARKSGLASVGAVRNAVFRLRRKLERNPAAPEHLLSAPGGCYRLECRISRPAGQNEHLAALISLTDYLGAVLSMPDCVVYARTGGSVRQVAAFGPKRCPNRGVRQVMTQAFGEGIVGAAAQLLEPVVCLDTAADARYVQDIVPAGSELAVPVVLRGRLVGVIDLEHPSKNAIANLRVEILLSLAAIAAPAFAGMEESREH